MKKQDRFVGCLLGLALGDALGAPMEFVKKSFNNSVVTSMEKNPFNNYLKGFWTDDTSMALCTAHSIIQERYFNLDDQMQNFVKWFRQGFLSSINVCFDIGDTVRASLEEYEETGQINTEVDPFDESLSNGSLMRLAPTPLFFYSDVDKAAQKSIASSLLTHKSKMCANACACLSTFITCSFHDHLTKFELCADVIDYIESLFSEIGGWLLYVLNSKTQPNTEQHIGYVMLSLQVALWAFLTTDNFRDGAIAAVNIGGDSDTYGAIYGQIAGAFYGYEHIATTCSDWLEDLTQLQQVIDYGKILSDLARP